MVFGPPCIASAKDEWNVYGALMHWSWQRKKGCTERETCYSATLSTVNPIWISLQPNTCLHSDRPAANRFVIPWNWVNTIQNVHQNCSKHQCFIADDGRGIAKTVFVVGEMVVPYPRRGVIVNWQLQLMWKKCHSLTVKVEQQGKLTCVIFLTV